MFYGITNRLAMAIIGITTLVFISACGGTIASEQQPTTSTEPRSTERVLEFVGVGGQEIDQTFDFSEGAYFGVEHLFGQATISGWDRDELSISGTLNPFATVLLLTIDEDSASLLIEHDISDCENFYSDACKTAADNLMIKLPHHVYVEYKSKRADLTIDKLHGGLEASLVNGNINGRDIDGEVDVESVNGSIHFDGHKGEFEGKTVNGDIRLTQLVAESMDVELVNGQIDLAGQVAELEAESVNGDINVDLEPVESLELESVTGNLSVRMALAETAEEVSAETINGDIMVSFAGTVNAEIDAEVRSQGKLSYLLPMSDSAAPVTNSRGQLSVSLGNSTTAIDLRTTAGDITLKPTN